ncbi:MAG: type II toxin-antitoxin system MqsA family antitoxin [Hyphomicrobiales bacterium]|nr:type II toxin-antitoxin system MqsA family antitoxin [Hyphomicrobiales bacterium]MDE2115056.1 type II toxin-antitoxin system MqsA family antitoxin [Hyphomicrobiales bacterium]
MRFENGKTKPPSALVKLFKFLDCHPDLLREVWAARRVRKEPLVRRAMCEKFLEIPRTRRC